MFSPPVFSSHSCYAIHAIFLDWITQRDFNLWSVNPGDLWWANKRVHEQTKKNLKSNPLHRHRRNFFISRFVLWVFRKSCILSGILTDFVIENECKHHWTGKSYLAVNTVSIFWLQWQQHDLLDFKLVWVPLYWCNEE